jgi:hypothetical protein
MNYAIVDAVLGLLIGAACIGIPQLVRKRRQRPDDADTEAYLKETHRSAQDIAQSNAALQSQQKDDARTRQAGGSDGPLSHADASSRETS